MSRTPGRTAASLLRDLEAAAAADPSPTPVHGSHLRDRTGEHPGVLQVRSINYRTHHVSVNHVEDDPVTSRWSGTWMALWDRFEPVTV
ncbi:hypothetical protein ACWGJ9_11815 [Curtobacterium citreum]